MKLYIKQKVFSWGDKFTVKNAGGLDRFFVEGEVFALGKKLHVYNRQGQEVAYIEQKILALMPRYIVYVRGKEVAQVVRRFSLFPQYRVEGLEWDVEGNFFAHEYRVFKAGRTIASIRKVWMSWGDSYELDIADPSQEIMSLAVLLAIDAATESDNSN